MIRTREDREKAARAFLNQEKRAPRNTVSGTGSTTGATSHVRQFLEAFIRTRNIQSIVDVPCGDLWWMKNTNIHGASYTGLDLIPEVVEKAQAIVPSTWEASAFNTLDIVTETPPTADLIICRDLFPYITTGETLQALQNLLAAKPSFLALSSWGADHNGELKPRASGWGWRAVNLTLSPYLDLGEPLASCWEQGKKWLLVFPVA